MKYSTFLLELYKFFLYFVFIFTIEFIFLANDSLPSDETVHLKPTRKSKNKPPPAQRIVLENALNTYGPYCKGKYHELALATGLSQHRIRVWFHSRRTWLKNKGILPRVATFTERMSDEDKDSLNQHYLSWIQDQSRYAQKAKKK